MKCFALTVTLLAAVAVAGFAQPYEPNPRTLLLDHLDDSFIPNGKLCTTPAVMKPSAGLTGGRPTAGGAFVPGKFGKALQFHGLMAMNYPGPGNINLTAGVAEFWVALDFDAAVARKNPGPLSNQLFFTVWGPGASQVCVYSTLGRTCVGVWDKNRQLVCYASFEGDWKKGEWHHLELRWGRQLELLCDSDGKAVQGERKATADWVGLFGPVDVKPDDVRISFGSHIGWSGVHSEFALDEIHILGPGGDQVPDFPTMTVPRIHAPTIDGRLEPGEWDGAAQTTGFVGLNNDVLVDDQTIVRAGWDDEALYLSYECLDPQKRPLIAVMKDRDSAVYGEDAVDVFLQPRPLRAPYYQLISNAIGTRYDSRVTPARPPQADTRFNPNWTVKTNQEPGRWVMEAKIPFHELDGLPTPRDGERWRVNFCRDADSASRLSSWAYTAGNFHNFSAFGEMIFSNSDRAIRTGPLGDWALGRIEALVGMTGISFDPLVIVRGKVVGSDAKTIIATDNRLADYRAVTVKAPPLVSGLYQLTLRASTAAGDLYYQRLPFRVIKPYDITAEGYPYEGKLWVTANISGLPKAPAGTVARSRLLRGNTVLGSCEAHEFVRGQGAASIDISTLPPGKYLVKSDAVAPDGKVLASAEAEFEQFSQPSWWHSKVGIDHTVPWPWTPVRFDHGAVKVWGREFRCGTDALVGQIVNQGSEVLAGPISLQLAAGGKTVDLARLPSEVTSAADDALTRTASAAAGDVRVQLRTTTEFDGMQRCDVTLTPAAATSVSRLTLEIPIKRQFATFLLSSTGSSGTARKLGDEPWRSAFLPQVWVGNDDLGFAWFAESPQYWRPHDEQMIEVVPSGDRTVLRCNIVRQPLKLDKPVTITFGLMPTPVKDAHAGDPFWFRFGAMLGDPMAYDDAQHSQVPAESLVYPGKSNLDPRQGTVEFWMAPTAVGGAASDVMSITGSGSGMALTYNQGAQRMDLTVTAGGKSTATHATGIAMTPGSWTHVAVTWQNDICLYINGKQCGKLDSPLPSGMVTEPDKLKLCFGRDNPWYGSTRILIDEVRVSKSVRYTGGMYPVPAAPFAADADTLLLDHLDDRFRPDGEDAETRPAVISDASGELGGIPSIGCKFVNGRFGSGLEIAMGAPVSSAAANKEWGSNAWCYWDWFADANKNTYGWPAPLFVEPERGNIRPLLKQLREAGLRTCPYMAYTGIGAPTPISRQFGAEWSRQPLSTQPAEPPKGHYFLDCCAHSGYADYIAAGTAWVIDNLGFYGCYTDGLAHVYPCKNIHHGCGYYDDKGVLQPTWPIFATRELMKRMYRIIHSRHQDGFLVNHVSFDLFIPTDSFTDVYYTGEHEQYEDLTKFRVRWQGKQWGIWPILLGADAHSYTPMHYTYGLLHGVSVWPQGAIDRNDMERKTVNLWKTYDSFDYRHADWIPYYRAEPNLVQVNDDNVKISLYLHRGKRALMVVGNLKHEVTTCNLKLNLPAMGLHPKGARNALSDRPLPLQGNTLSVRIRPVSFVLVWLE